ncbi:inositol monophosphatase family protein [Pseudovibrio denitrificans]|uniref:inositol monophosphatase family protein n=1 Tax=Pseudovibrio denitrificans TaxID=258256 RepID=UPI0039BF3B78
MGNMGNAALTTAEVILDLYEELTDDTLKHVRSPVTQADRDTEKAISPKLSASAAAYPFIVEETTSSGKLPYIGDEFFLVDPLDGSKEFLIKNGEFTENIAFLQKRSPKIRVVFASAKGWLFAGEVSSQCWRVDDRRVNHSKNDKRSMKYVAQIRLTMVLIFNHIIHQRSRIFSEAFKSIAIGQSTVH